MPVALLALFLCTFAIGTTEFVIAGLLPAVAADFEVTIATAGFLITGYAIGVAVGGPLTALALSRLPSKVVLVLLLVAFTLGQIVCALAGRYETLLLARVLVACTHGAFFGVGAIVAARQVAPERQGRALALLLSGLTVANVLGVPAGTAIGAAFGWRATFWAVGATGLVALVALIALVPDSGPADRAVRNVRREIAALGRPVVLSTFAILILGMTGLFSLFTYVAPLLTEVAGLAPRLVPGMLLLFGIGSTIGVIAGGRLADWKLMPALIGILLVQASVYVVLAMVSTAPAALGAAVFLWGAAAFAFTAPGQAQVLRATSDAPTLASSLIPAAFNVGIATGALLGSIALRAGAAYDDLPWIGVAASLSAAGIGLAFAARRRGTAVAQP